MAGSPVVVLAETAQQELRSPEKRQTRSDPTRAEKRTASRFYQLKSGHALTDVYLKSMENRPDDHCWWCDPESNSGTRQTRDHLFKHFYKWKDQRAVVWARVEEATKRGKQKWRVGDLGLDSDGVFGPSVVEVL